MKPMSFARRLVRFALFVAECLAAVAALATEPRFALVIGNGSYAAAPLANASNDASAVARVLQKAGFAVDLKLNASQKQMQDGIVALGAKLRGDAVGLFYFAGHGVQLHGRNYLIPVGSAIQRESDIVARTVDVQQLLDRMGNAHNRMNVVILDACRDNPFSADGRAGAGGLSQLDAPTGSLIAFATAPGQVASDGKGVNGLYTQHLLANIERTGTPIEEVFKRVRLGVRLDSNGAQIPWESTSLDVDFYFFPGAPDRAAAQTTLPPPPGVEEIARAELGYELLRQRKFDAAEREFRTLAQSPNTEVALMGQEGLAEALLARGNPQAALAEANAIIAKAPARSAPYLIRGRALAVEGRARDSAASFQTAADPKTSADFWWQKAGALVAVGNDQRKQDPKLAVKTYERAAREDPKSVDALSNMAVALNESGDPQRARAALEKALAIDPKDAVAAALMRQVRDSLAERDDLARQRYVDDTVKELSARFRNPPAKSAPPADDWTSPALALTVLPFADQSLASLTGGRIGVDALIQQALIQELQARGYTIVERRLLDKLMNEINLGSSALADPDTQIRLGRVLAARLMVSGTLTGDAAGSAVAVRAIDTETTRLALVRSEPAADPVDPAQVAAKIADDIARTIKDKYPLKGRVVEMDGERAIINLGRKQGVVAGQTFNVLGPPVPIEMNGRVLGYKDAKVAQVTVSQVDELLSYVRVDTPGVTLAKQQRVIARSE
jgi:tetratricopeptide (TPR) repeat protein